MVSGDAGDDGALIGTDGPPAFKVVNASGGASVVLVCDHASNRIPRVLGDLGLSAAQRASHIAWDPGAALVARGLSVLLDAPLVRSGYSRLVIDCNRPLASPESIATASAGVSVPGNQALAPRARALRQRVLFRPYHQAIAGLLDARAHRTMQLLSIHSFTPILGTEPRPWAIGVSHRQDRGLGGRLLTALAAEPGLCIGDNLPYPIEDAFDYTLPTHGEARGLANCMIELRQDGLRTQADAMQWAQRLAQAWQRAGLGNTALG